MLTSSDIDRPVSPDSIAAAKALITASLEPSTSPHPSLPPLREPTTTSAFSPSLAQPPTSTPLDTTRYTAPTTAPADPEAALPLLATNKAYQSSRATNLGLLETFGRNAWLISNAALEDTLRDLEAEVKLAREGLAATQRARQEAQAAQRGELEALERAWREGVGRSIEVQVACDKVREEILARRRAGAQ